MNSAKIEFKFQRAAWIIAGLAVTLALGIWLSSQVSMPLPVLQGAQDDAITVGAYGPFTLVFAAPMEHKSVERRLALEPAVIGTFTWKDTEPQQVTFTPDKHLTPGQPYTLRLEPGAASQGGRALRRALTWQVKVRAAEILALSPVNAPELWRIPRNGQNPQPLTSTGGSIYDFTVSLDGRRIVYSARNAQNGIDLWEIDRQGGQARQLLPCGADWCINPAISPDETKIAYARRVESGAGGDPSAPRLWMLDDNSLSTEPLYIDPNVGGAEPAWSADGRYLACVDELSQGVRVINMAASADGQKDFLLPAGPGTALEWSPDSRHLLYTASDSTGESPYIQVREADLDKMLVDGPKTRVLLGDDSDEYSVPDWSADGEWLAAARREVNDGTGKQVWLLRADGTHREQITADALSNFGAVHWDPTGQALVLQQHSLSDPSSPPRVVLWNRGPGTLITLLEDAYQPQWVP